MKQKGFYDPYTEVLDKFNRRGIQYVVVGMSGINYYASGARDIFATQDYDIFVKPTIENLEKAISLLKKLNYTLIANEMPLDEGAIKAVVRDKKTVSATDPYGINIELILAVSGFTFSQMERDAKVFEVGEIPIKVAKLTKLLISKKIAGRSKDRLFLKRYENLLSNAVLHLSR